MLGKAKKRKPNRVDSLIGQQSHVLGDIRFGGGLHIDGTIKGNVSADGDDSFSDALRDAAQELDDDNSLVEAHSKEPHP